MALSLPAVVNLEQLDREVEADDKLRKTVNELREDPSKWPDYSVKKGQLLYKSRLVLPKGSTLVQLVMQEGHDGSLGGHSRFLKTYKRISMNVYWAGMKKDIQRYVKNCTVFVNKINMKLYPRKDCYNHWPFLIRYGKT